MATVKMEDVRSLLSEISKFLEKAESHYSRRRGNEETKLRITPDDIKSMRSKISDTQGKEETLLLLKQLDLFCVIYLVRMLMTQAWKPFLTLG